MICVLVSTLNTDSEYTLKPPKLGGFSVYMPFLYRAKIKQHNVYPCSSKSILYNSEMQGSKLHGRVCMLRNLASSKEDVSIFISDENGSYI